MERKTYIDYIRALACIAIIVLHVITNKIEYVPVGDSYFYFMNSVLVLTRWAVPVFFMITGACVLGRGHTGNWIGKHVLKLLIALMAWGIFYVAIGPLLSVIKYKNFSYLLSIDWAGSLFKGEAFHLWFMFSMISMYMLIPILDCIVVKKSILRYFLLIWFVYSFVISKYMIKINGFEFFDFRMISGYSGYLLLGYYVDNYLKDDKVLNKFLNCKAYIGIFVVVTLITMVLTCFLCNIKGSIVNIASPFSLYAIVSAVCVFQFFRGIKETRVLNAVLKPVSKYSFGIYLVHSYVIIKLLHKGIHSLMMAPYVAIPIVSLLAFILSFAIVVIISKIPVIGKYIV